MKTKANTHTPFRLPVLLALGAVGCAVSAQGITLSYEGFDMPAGELDFTSGATSFGWKRDNSGEQLAWWAWDQATNDLYHGVSEEGLAYPGLPSIGNAFEFRQEVFNETNYNWAYRQLPKFYSYNSSGQLWLSAIFSAKITGDPGGGGWFQLCLSDFHNAAYLGLANTSDQSVWSAGGERLKVGDVAGEKWAYSEVPVEDGVPAFLVLHLDFDNKTGAFYANPPVDAEDPGEPVAEFTMWSDIWFDKIMLWSINSGPSVEGEGADYIGSRVDEIRLGTTYASVAAGADLTDPGGGSVDLDPPVITGVSGPAGSASSTKTIPENTVQVGTLTANESVSWSIAGGIDGDFFTIGVGTGGLSFKEFPDFETPLDSNAGNDYVVQVQAMDEAGNTATQIVLVKISDVDDEVPPVITGLSGAAGDPESAASIEENTTLVGLFTADETATWDLSGGADEARFAIGEGTGVLSFLAGMDFETPVDVDADNVYEVEVRATDASGNTARQVVLVTVLDVDESGDTVPPVITGLSGSAGDPASSISIDENTTTVGTLSADETVTWILSGGADSAFFQIDLSSGALAFVSAPDFESPGDADGNNVYLVEIEATDTSGNVASHAVSVSVLDVGEVVTWAHWTPDANGWVHTDENDGAFVGWINVADDPWIFCLSLDRHIFMPASYVSNSGSWFYAQLFLANPTPGEWAFWARDDLGWVNTESFLGWLNVYNGPWVNSTVFDNYLYLAEESVTANGAWVYALLRLPAD